MNEIEEKLNKALPEIARRFQNELMIKAPVDTGRLRNSIKVENTPNGLIISLVDYAKWVEFGSLPHIIEPKDKKALKFKKGKKDVFAKKVRHPGNRPNPWIRNTIRNKLATIIKEEILKVV